MKRFVNQDVLLGAISDSQSLNRYAYTNGNPINRLDPFGLCAAMLKNLGHLALNLLSTILLFTPFAPLGALLAGINAVWYFYDGDILGGLCSLGIVLGGVGGLIGGTAGLIMSGCGNLLMAGTSTWSAGQSIGKMYMDYQETGKINPWDVVSATMNLGMAVMGGYGAFKSFSSIPAIARIKEAEISARAARNADPENNRGPEGTPNTDTETYYRTMSEADYDTLLKTSNIPATSETFISPTQSFSEEYNGVTVEFKVKAGTTNELANIGVRDSSKIVSDVYGDMPFVSKGWTSNNAYFKGEAGQINIGLGKGTALGIFNNNIVGYEVVGSRFNI